MVTKGNAIQSQIHLPSSSKRKAAVRRANMKTNPEQPLKELNEYNEDSIYPPTSKQVKDAGSFPANAKAAACALQPPDPTRTMAFYE